LSLYQKFAQIYAQGQYPDFSLHFSSLLPELCRKYGIPTAGTLLDVACGEGTFAIQAAMQGWSVTGIDQSDEMLNLARKQSTQAGVNAKFEKIDMRELDFCNEYDLSTCLFDAVNYMLEEIDLKLTFSGVNRALGPSGWFIFDMNTIYGLSSRWSAQSNSVPIDTDDLIAIHRPVFDYERLLATMHITGFIRQNKFWERIDEIHQEKGYPIDTISHLLEETGFEVVNTLGSIELGTAPKVDSGRVWFIARKSHPSDCN
jgi:ubiquinone/menaquinone biosynthesis C-methylase UbiE